MHFDIFHQILNLVLFVCFFWGVFQIFFVFIGAGVESLAECKIQEKKGQKIFLFLFGIIMIVAPTIWMVSQIREFLEVTNYKQSREF